jgi:uncharacterized membrane protein YgcG
VSRARPQPSILAVFGLAIAAVWLSLGAAVRAADIPTLEGSITDQTGVLADGTADIQAAIDGTLRTDGVQAWVLFVPTTGDLTAADFAAETARQNSLGVDDALILVALDDRTDYLWVADGLSITDDELDAIITDTLEPGLRSGDYTAAVVDTVGALGEANVAASTEPPIVPGPVTAPPTGPTTPGATEGGGVSVGAILALFLIGGGLILIVWQLRRRALAGAVGTTGTATEPPPDPRQLARQANALLIATDERIRDAGQEVDFAEAQYGSDEVVDLRSAVASAKEELAAAFTVRQRLDDEVPEDEATRLAMLREIIDRTARAQGRLDAETDRIRQLRDLERDAPNTLVELPGRIEAVEDRLPAAEAAMARLGTYADSTWVSVKGDLEEARKGLQGARDAVIAGSAAASADDRAKVAVATREALEGLTGAATLLDGIDRLAATVADAERRLPAELGSARTDLADATAAMAGRALDPAVDRRRAAAAAAALDTAATAAAMRPLDPVEALRSATEAHRLADELLLATRDAVAAADRLAAAATASLRSAATEVDRTEAFIASRRRGVGETARTRFAEAQRHLSIATSLVATDPPRTLDEARRAEALAREAYQLAASDFDDWDQGGPGWGQRRGTSGDQTAAVLGQILGGVIGGVIAGGGRGGGWGGSPWGGSGGGGGRGGGWGGGGGFGSGGFGGGGGGGGHGRGGRW